MITCSYCGVGSGFYHKQRCEFYGMKFNAAASPVQGAASAINPAEYAGLKGEVETLQSRLGNAMRELEARRLHDKGDVWHWQGDGTDSLESMSMGMVVVIRADQLRAALAERAQAAQPTGVAQEQVDMREMWREAEQDPEFRAEIAVQSREVDSVLATPAPEREAAPDVKPKSWGECVWCGAPSDIGNRSCSAPNGDGHLFVKRLAAPVEQEAAPCPRCPIQTAYGPAKCFDCVGEQEAAQVVAVADDPSHVMRPSGAPAGQHGAGVAAPMWISVDFMLPEPDVEVLIDGQEGVEVAHYSEGEEDQTDQMGHDAGFWGYKFAACGRSFGAPDYIRPAQGQPKYWMHLPDPPEDCSLCEGSGMLDAAAGTNCPHCDGCGREPSCATATNTNQPEGKGESK